MARVAGILPAVRGRDLLDTEGHRQAALDAARQFPSLLQTASISLHRRFHCLFALSPKETEIDGGLVVTDGNRG